MSSSKDSSPSVFSSTFAALIGAQNRSNNGITPFTEIRDPPIHSSKKDPSAFRGMTGTTETGSFFPPPSSSFGEKMVASQVVPSAPQGLSHPAIIITTGMDDTATERTPSSRARTSQAVSFTSPPLTERQQLLEEEAGRLRLQIMTMVNSALSSGPNTEQNVQNENRQIQLEMARMREQIDLLEQDRDSSWARGLSNELPSYLNSIGR